MGKDTRDEQFVQMPRDALLALAESREAEARALRLLAERHEAATDDRIATCRDNPLGNEHTFRRLARAGAFPVFLGPRRSLQARWADVVAYQQGQEYTPRPPRKVEATDEAFDPFADPDLEEAGT